MTIFIDIYRDKAIIDKFFVAIFIDKNGVLIDIYR
jgi:hypothetical protein